MIRSLTALLTALLMLMMTCPASAQEGFARSYGGNGEDALPYMIAAADGLLAAGYTTSTDGDLSMRKRTGKAGWMLRLDSEGEALWSVCTAHVGRSEMHHPFAHADGTFSAILTAENEGSEWLRVSEGGKITARIEVPSPGGACAHGDAAACFPMPYEQEGVPMLALLVAHADGTSCCSAMDENGAVTHGADVFTLLPDGAFAVCRDGAGLLAAVHPLEGDAQVLLIVPGGQSAVRTLRVPVQSGKLQVVLDVLPCADGSVIFSGQLCATGSVVLRVSAEGETLFVVDDCENYERLTLTSAGFAGADDDKIAFYDEDGALLGSAPYEQSGFVCALAALSDGAALMQERFETVRKPMTVTAALSYAPAQPSGYPFALYTRPMSTLEAASSQDDRIALDVCDRHGERLRVILSGENASEQAPVLPRGLLSGVELPSGTLAWREDAPGARVTLTEAQGIVRFETATPIHTAADRVQWLCAAQTPDGGFLLGGRYLTEIIPNTEEKQLLRDMTRDGLSQEGVVARLGADGVLQSVTTLVDVGCVAAILPGASPADTVLLCARGDMTDSLLTNAVTLDQRRQGVLDAFLQPQNAALLMHGGSVFAAGTNMKNGRPTVVVQPIHMKER